MEGKRVRVFTTPKLRDKFISGEVVEFKEATFYIFSMNYEEFENGAQPYPVAVVSDDKGRVDSVYVECIQFIVD